MGVQDNAISRNNQNNESASTASLTTAGDMLINVAGTDTRLPIGAENQTLNVSGGIPTWQNGSRESFKESYYSIAGNPYWNSTWNDTGVPFDQVHIGKYKNSHRICANFKKITPTTGVIATVSTSAQGGLTAGTLTLYKNNCQELWSSLTGDSSDIAVLTDNLGTTGAQAITDLVLFKDTNVLSGIDLKLSDMASISVTGVANLNTWLGSLHTALGDCCLNITLPAFTNATISSAYNFDYSTFINNVDYLTINYDYCGANCDYGSGFPKVPIEAIRGGTYSDSNTPGVNGATAFYANGAIGKYIADNTNKMQKLIIGLPNTGYVHTIAQSDYTFSTGNLTRNTVNENGTFNTSELSANRDQSGTLFWSDATYDYTFSDETTIQVQVDAIRKILDKQELDEPTWNRANREIIFSSMGGGAPQLQRP